MRSGAIVTENNEKRERERDGKNRYLDINIYSVGLAPLNEGCPQPIVHIRIAHIADHIGPPVDTLNKINFNSLLINLLAN